MPRPAALANGLALPVIAAPMFIVSNPELVLAQCLSGVIGSFPALNARPAELLEDWLTTIHARLEAARAAEPGRAVAPYAVNLIVHGSNQRLEQDLACCVRHRVPLVITSLHAPDAVVEAVHAYGGLVFHDAINLRHARRAIAAGVDGLILVAAGAGGHAGTLSPFALVAEVRRIWDGPIALSGAIATGGAILAAEAMGADFAYIGTPFIATDEANATPDYKQGLVEAAAADIVYTPYFTGVSGNYLRSSILAAGLDPEHLGERQTAPMNVSDGTAKAWRDVWGAGQGVGSLDAVVPAAALIARLGREYAAAKRTLCG